MSVRSCRCGSILRPIESQGLVDGLPVVLIHFGGKTYCADKWERLIGEKP